MDTLPLPPRPNLEQYRKRAKSLVVAAHSGNPQAVADWGSQWLDALVARLDEPPSAFVRDSMARAFARIAERVANDPPGFAISDAQYLIAEAHGFETWAAFARHLGRDERAADHDAEFERAADAVVSGDLGALSQLVAAHPELIHARSSRVHHVTLLHYVAANGVEDFRQKTPRNAVDITRFLLDAGAEPDALADTYGADTLQTPMNLLVSSVHPASAGLQSAIAEALLDYGAKVNGVADDESPLLTALWFGYGEVAETLARRGARVDAVVTAAALGRLALLKEMVVDATTLRPGVPLVSTPWTPLPLDTRLHVEYALAWACKFARTDVALYLLGLGVNPAAKDSNDMTALHWASANGMLEVMDELLRRGAPLEVENAWGGPVLNSTLHFVQYMPVKRREGSAFVDYVPVIERLLKAGANAQLADYPTGKPAIDALLARFRT